MSCLGMSFVSFSGFLDSRLSSVSCQGKDVVTPRKSLLSSKHTQGKSKVVVVQGMDIHKMMRKGLEALELPEDFFKDKKAVIKPNTHWSELYPSTTDPVSVLPVIDFLCDRKSGNIAVADGSGVDLPSFRSAFEYIGFEKVLAKKRVDIVPIDIWKIDDFLSIESSKWSILKSLSVHPIIHRTPVLISMTCLKRHGSPHLTAALKNNIGALSARSRYHVHYRIGGRIKEAIPEVADAVHPDISIIDARDILVNRGPMFMPDKSNLKKGVNKLLISTDMAALDTVASQLMAEHDNTFQMDQFQPTLDRAQKLNLGNIDTGFIEIVNLQV